MFRTKPEKQNSTTTHDFFNDKTWLLNMMGFRQSRKTSYLVYRGFLLTLMSCLTLMAVYAAIVAPNKNLAIDATHYCLLAVHAIWGLIARLLTHRSLSQTRKILISGVYHYPDEQEDEDETKIKEGIVAEVNGKFNFTLFLTVSGLIGNQLLFPLSQSYFLTEDDYIVDEDWMNPNLPHYLYMPFSTRSLPGYCIAYAIDSVGYCCVYLTTLSMCLLYISCEVQLKTHLKVLRYSLAHIQERAFRKYRNRRSTVGGLADIDAYDMHKSEHFQACLDSCLKSNVEHHQALERLLKQFGPFIGSSLLVIFLVVAIIYAAELYLLFQKPNANLMVKYVLTFATESTYAYQICVFGEEIIEESHRLHQSLYGIPWFQYGKRFNQSLHIMMSNTIKPLQFRSLLLGTSASVDSYGSLLSAMYKIMNLVRQSDALT